MAQKLKKGKIPVTQGQEGVVKNAAPGLKPKNCSLSDFRMQALLLAMIAIVFYCNTFSHGSAFDDRMAITDNNYVLRGFAGIYDILTKDAFQSYLEQKNGANQLAGGRYRPLSLITYAIEQQFMGTTDADEKGDARETRINEQMHLRHLVNVAFYMLSVIVLLYFLRTVIFPSNPSAAFIAALLFSIHPLHTEVVANVKSRDEILSLLFISLTFIQAFRYKERGKTKYLILALVSFFLALLSKEYGVTLILLLPLFFYIFRKETIIEGIKSTLPYLIPLGLYLLLRFIAVSGMAEGAENNVMNNPYLFATGVQKIATEFEVLITYLRLLFYPAPLICDYSYNQVPYTSFANPIVWLAIITYSGMVVAMVLLVKQRHLLGFALAFFLANLLLVSNFFINIGAPMGERLVYHSSLGFSIIIAWLLFWGFQKINNPAITRNGLPVIMVFLILACGYKTIDRNKDWKNDETLFMADIKNAPNSVLINNNAAANCMNMAKKSFSDTVERRVWFEKAVSYFSKAISIYPGHMLAHLNRGLCYFNMGSPEMALPDWDTVRNHEPNTQNLAKYLGIAGKYFYSKGMNYEKNNQNDSAVHAFKLCTDATPEAPEPWFQLALACKMTGRPAEAKSAILHALQIAPNNREAKQLLGDIENAPRGQGGK